MKRNDFNIFFCFVKGVLITAEVIKASPYKLKHSLKYHFNQTLANCKMFEKYMEEMLGKDIAAIEDEVNSSIIGIVWNIYSMEGDERDAFIQHMESFDYNPENKDAAKV